VWAREHTLLLVPGPRTCSGKVALMLCMLVELLR